jgi:hypothetical protein
MRRAIIAALILVIVAAAGWAQAEFTEVNGKVEIRPAGASAWIPARVGARVAPNTMISTGFGASAALRMGASTVRVDQLTRLEFEEIAEQSDSVQTRLSLNAGRMSAQVRSVDGRRQDFRVRSPISTAAVRGTDFFFDGERIDVGEGLVDFLNALEQARSVAEGQWSQTNGTDEPSPPSEEFAKDADVDNDPVGLADDVGSTGGGATGGGAEGSIRIEIQ